MKNIVYFLLIIICSSVKFSGWASVEQEINQRDSIILLIDEQGVYDTFLQGEMKALKNESCPLSILEHSQFQEENKEAFSLLTDSIIKSFPLELLDKMANLKANPITICVIISPKGKVCATSFYISKSISKNFPYKNLEKMEELVMRSSFKCNFTGKPHNFTFSFVIPRGRIKNLLSQK